MRDILQTQGTFERKLRPDRRKKQVLAVKIEGVRQIQEKITARLGEKASTGRKN